MLEMEVRYCAERRTGNHYAVLAPTYQDQLRGKAHGGALMKWIYQTGYACAVGWSGQYCVTVYVGGEEGYEHHDILYTLLFLTCHFLPALRLTPLGLLDVKSSEVLLPAEAE